MAIVNNYTNQETVKSQLKTKGDCYSTGGQIGYGTGAGSVVTQGSSRTTTVVSDGQCGQITLYTTSNSTTAASFTVTCAAVLSTSDVIVLSQVSGTDKLDMQVTAVAVGSFQITQRTYSGTTSEAPVINYMVFKGVAA
jgi:hypothetical protein